MTLKKAHSRQLIVEDDEDIASSLKNSLASDCCLSGLEIGLLEVR